MPSLSLISVNIEGNRHLGRILPFLKQANASVVCLQEVFEHDLLKLKEELSVADHLFAPMMLKKYQDEDEYSWQPMGIGILSKIPASDKEITYYHRPHPEIQKYQGGTTANERKAIAVAYAYMAIDTPEGRFPIATTHFTWTPDGTVSDDQQTDAKALLAATAKYNELLLCGDFNAPRGYNEIYDHISAKYIDHIPPKYAGSIDLSLHRNGSDPVEGARMANFMVDYIFSTPHFTATNVELVSGVSDHKAVIGTISKLSPTAMEATQSAGATI